MERDMNPMPDDLTPEELMAEADSAEALPERAVMSTLNVTSLDAAGGAVEAVGDGVPDGAPAESGGVPIASETAPQSTGSESGSTDAGAPSETATQSTGSAGESASTASASEPQAGSAAAD